MRLIDNLDNKEEFDNAPRLIPRTADVNKYNTEQYNKLNTHSYKFDAIDTYCNGPQMTKKVKKSDLYSKVEKLLELEQQPLEQLEQQPLKQLG